MVKHKQLFREMKTKPKSRRFERDTRLSPIEMREIGAMVTEEFRDSPSLKRLIREAERVSRKLSRRAARIANKTSKKYGKPTLGFVSYKLSAPIAKIIYQTLSKSKHLKARAVPGGRSRR
jgi:predicted AAA+ superfamily ATPase